jgi:hypothetical protein
VSLYRSQLGQAEKVILLQKLAWFVVSKSVKSTVKAQSDTWKFYNAGPGTISHPLFPAESLSPSYAQNVTALNGTINLTRAATDPDNDIAGYDIYFGIDANPAKYKSNLTD